MQKSATKIFMCASITFGIIGVVTVMTASGSDQPDSSLTNVLMRILFANGFIILSSFALSVAGKYLNGKS